MLAMLPACVPGVCSASTTCPAFSDSFTVYSGPGIESRSDPVVGRARDCPLFSSFQVFIACNMTNVWMPTVTLGSITEADENVCMLKLIVPSYGFECFLLQTQGQQLPGPLAQASRLL